MTPIFPFARVELIIVPAEESAVEAASQAPSQIQSSIALWYWFPPDFYPISHHTHQIYMLCMRNVSLISSALSLCWNDLPFGPYFLFPII